MTKQSLLPLLLLLGLIFNNCQPKTNNEKTTEDSQIVDEHNAQNSLDWHGTYKGVLPCADCEGITTTITLNQDMSYSKQSQYLGKDELVFEEEGTFTWNKAGNTVALSGIEDGSNHYFVGENQLFHLDQEGNRISGPLAENYILKKVMEHNNSESILTQSYWKLITLEGKPVEVKSDFSDKEIHITFNTEENRIFGFAGCNSFGGFYEIVGEESVEAPIKFTQLYSTQMACPDLDIESELFKVLENTKTYSINKEVLTLQDAEKVTLAKFEATFK